MDVDDQASADPEEMHPGFAELVRDHVLELPELVGDEIGESVFEMDHGVVPFRADEHQPVGGETKELRARGYLDHLFHPQTKIEKNSIGSTRLFSNCTE